MPDRKRNPVAQWLSDFQLGKEGGIDEVTRLWFETAARAANSRFATGFINQLPCVQEANGQLQRLLLENTLEPLPPTDPDSALENLLAMPGFDKCEKDLMRLKKSIGVWQKQGADLSDKRTALHVVIFSEDEQNATDFARHYQAFLAAIGVLSYGDSLMQVDGASQTSTLSAYAMESGMCLVANARELSDQSAANLSEIMNEQQVIIVASYAGKGAKLQDSLEHYEFFLRLQLSDEREDSRVIEVQDAVEAWMESKFAEMNVEEGFRGPWTKTFAERVVAQTEGQDQKKSLGVLEIELRNVLSRQHTRLVEGDMDLDPCWITREDLLGGEPTVDTFDSEAWTKLHKMVGLHAVKASLESFADGALLDYHRAMHGHPPARSGLSRLFIGPPGTGKTTVGKLYGQILCSLDILSSGDFIQKKGQDFIGRYIGESETKTRKILDSAKGKVLFIDEAYMLDPTRSAHSSGADPFRQGVIDTIVGEVQNSPGEDICVILAGYKDEMEHMLQHANPGLARRFPMEQAFVFEEFSTNELEQVLDMKVEESQFSITDEAKTVAMDLLQLAKQRKNFGNGGEVDIVLGRAKSNMKTRFSKMSSEERRHAGVFCFQPEDFDPDWQQVLHLEEHVPGLLMGMIGVDDVRDRLISLTGRATRLRKHGCDPAALMPFCFAFKGPRGTGKRTVARKVAWLFHSMRLISSKEVIQTSVRDLVQNRAGARSRGKPSSITDVMKEALGKTLVIDEAHRLLGEPNDQSDTLIRQVREELIEALNGPHYVRKEVIILTGSEKSLERMLDASPELGSKFSERLQFQGLTADACFQQLREQLQVFGISLESTTKEARQLDKAFEALCHSTEWAHNRDVQLLASELIGSVFDKESDVPVVSGSDILRCIRNKFPRQLSRLPASSKPDSVHPTKAVARSGINVANPAHDQPSGSSSVTDHDESRLGLGQAASGPSFPVSDERETFSTLSSDTAHPKLEHAVNGPITDLHQLAVSSSPRSRSVADTKESIPDPVTMRLPTQPKASAASEGSQPELRPANDVFGTYRYHKLPAGPNIRVLRIQPATGFHDPITCSLENVCLQQISGQRKHYNALSYVWGEKRERTQQICCDGQTMRIPPNCELAIRYMRSSRSPCVLWIDAICIDQESPEERNTQVALMGEIYKSAVHVYIWLGPGSQRHGPALAQLQKLCCLAGDWGEHSNIQSYLFRKYQSNFKKITASNALMKNRWWKRMWTFQEFILARRPIFVVGHMKLLWDDFQNVISDLIVTDRPGGTNKRQWLQAKKSTAIRQLVPDDCDAPAAEVEEAVHMLPMWLEVGDAMMCRKAYQERLKSHCRPTFMSFFLLKSRNRQATDPRDKIYGLYYLFQVSGFTLPQIDYRQSVEQVYGSVARALLQQSESWWLLSHLFNKRRDSSHQLPSWVPDFSQQAVWHQGADLRFQSLNGLELALEREQTMADQRTNKPFIFRDIQSGLVTDAVFVWKVTGATNELRSSPVLDYCFEEKFEQTDFVVIQDALEEFMFVLSDWVKAFEPTEDMPNARPDGYTPLADDDDTYLESQVVIKAIACAFYRGSSNLVRSWRQKMDRHLEESEDPIAVAARAEDHQSKVESILFLCRLFSNVRACASPDPMHPCRICGITEPHPGGEAAQHFTQWLFAQGMDKLSDVRYLLYARAIDHALFRTSATERCPGHFGFCRNSPRAGDEIVLLPGLSDPVIVQRRGPDCYKIVGVTNGMVGLSIVDDSGYEGDGSLCLGVCVEIEDWDNLATRSFQLV
ncbi:hypothetical protein LTR85_010824 [Meristemomyces frigidus]|nr:hypothetical protein LTR85_010824 [Meristemomyces frigidus]